MTLQDYHSLSPDWPHNPGVYRFLAADGKVLYVGKAKNLRNRLSSYFSQTRTMAYKTRVMVKQAHRVEYTLVETETDALLLENSLIKRFQPPYNVMLKDGKNYNYVRILNEPFPRISITRHVIRDGSSYFGPYTSKSRLKTILELIRQLFPVRTCQLDLHPDQLARHAGKGKYRTCLEFQIKNCTGPCERLESQDRYLERMEQVKNLLRGNFGPVKRHLQEEMARHVESLAFEKAQTVKEKLAAFEDYQSKSTVVSATIRDVDVFSIAGDEKNAYVNYLKVVDGAIINTYTQELVKNLNEDEQDLLSFTIPTLREKFRSIAPEIIVPFPVAPVDEVLTVTIPKIGDKKKLLDLSEKNVQYFLLQQKKSAANRSGRQSPAERILRTLQQDLQLKDIPLHIECFDNSNLQGSFPVSSCVVFRNARPCKSDYRHYNVKSVEGPNDFATMEEVVGRRYKRLLEEGQALPQLVIIDGGKGQLGAATKVLSALGVLDRMTVIGIAKRLEEIFFPGDPVPLYINKKSESLKLIQQARNEAHRFAITFHRQQRSRNLTRTELHDIPGIGPKTAEKLLRHFGSVNAIRAADLQSLENVAGKALADRVRLYFGQTDSSPDTTS
ncbi:MAG: hypothetical protein RLY31_1344 [Bacteroidota bacterium]|jgi:excinuclease ABC subunit C